MPGGPVDARRGRARVAGGRHERLDAARLDEHVVVEQHGVRGAVLERAREAGVGAAGEAAVVAQAHDDRAVRRIDARAVAGLVVDEHAPRGRRDLREAPETGAGALAGAPCDDDRSDAHSRGVYRRIL